MNIAEKILDTLKNVQVRPSKVRVEINDKTSKAVFRHDDEIYEKLLSGKAATIVEVKNHKKHGKIKTKYKLQNKDGYGDTRPLTELDRDILSACIAEWLAGNQYTTPDIIFRALVGKVGEHGINPTPAMKDLIIERLRKLMFTEFSSDIGESYSLLKYTNGDELKYLHSAILPACIVQAKINGQIVDAIFFDRESPLLTISNLKNQIVRYDSALLDIPNQNNTPLVISLKNYVMRRICEIKLHKQLTPTLTFDDIYKKCGIDNAGKKTKYDARNTVVKLMQHLADQHFIDSFEIVKNPKGNKIHAVTFTFSEPAETVPVPEESVKAASQAANNTAYSNQGTTYSNQVTLAPSKNTDSARRRLNPKDKRKNG